MNEKTDFRIDLGDTNSAEADKWIQQFIKQFELQMLDVSRHLSPGAIVSESQLATARAIVAAFLETGLEFESVAELFGRAIFECRSADVAWDDSMNRRRFSLIDKEIQGTLTSAEVVELAGLTRIMREHVDVEANLPMDGARALHRKLLQLEPTGEAN